MRETQVQQREPRRVQAHQSAVIARRIRVALAEQDSNVSELARRLDWRHAYIYRRMSGDTAWLVSDLWQIANLLGLDPAALMAEPEDPEHAA